MQRNALVQLLMLEHSIWLVKNSGTLRRIYALYEKETVKREMLADGCSFTQQNYLLGRKKKLDTISHYES